MLAYRLAVLTMALVAAPEGDDPAELVKRLGGSQYADRSAAGEALVKIGRAAVPDLIKASEDRDPEIRTRAERLIARIDAAEALAPTSLSLDFRDRPVAEVAAAIEAASGRRIRRRPEQGHPRSDGPWPDLRIDLATDGPRPFWEVLDRFSRASGLQRDFADRNFGAFRPAFEMILAPGKVRPPARDVGPFRVELLRVRYLRDRNFEPNDGDFRIRRDMAAGVSESSSYAAELLVSAEPKLRLIGLGAVEHAEADDERGRSLVKLPTPEEARRLLESWRLNPHTDPTLHPGLRFGSGSRSSSGSIPIQIPLNYPTPPASKIARLAGTVPVLAVGRRPDPLIVPLKGAKGQVFAAGTEKITVHDIQAEPGRQPVVEFTLETDRPDNERTTTAMARDGTAFEVNAAIDQLTLRLEVVDARDEPVSWQFNKAPSGNTQGRMAIVFNGPDGVGLRIDDLRIRCWRLATVAAELPFEFRDVPTP